MGQFDLANRIKINNPSGDNDLMYGPYIDKATALSTVVEGLRDKGRKVGILNNGAVEDWWWKSGVLDDDLIPYINGGGQSIITDTYENIKQLVDSNSLVPESTYIIADYQTKHLIPNSDPQEINIGNIEPLTLIAATTNTFYVEVKSSLFPTDILHYRFDDDSCEDGTRDVENKKWTSGTQRNGYIQYRKSTTNNLSTHYDWRNYKVRRWKLDCATPQFGWFGSDFNGKSSSITIQPDGKILVGGVFTTYQGIYSPYLIRLNSDYTLDSNLNIGTGFNGNVECVVLQPDGKILVGGNFTTYQGITSKYLIRLESDGSIDASFDVGTSFDDIVSSITIQPDGKILVSGYFTTYQGITSKYLIRLENDGSFDASFDVGTSFSSPITSIILQPDGKILVGGYFGQYQGISVSFFVRLNNDATIDNTLHSGFNSDVKSIALQLDGKILVGGNFTTYRGITSPCLIRLESDGSIDTSFNIGDGFDNPVRSITIQPDGKILVGGEFTTYQGITSPHLIRLESDGSIDTSFNIGDGFDSSVYSITIQPDGKLFIGGFFSSYNNILSQYLTILNSNGTLYININKYDLIKSAIDNNIYVCKKNVIDSTDPSQDTVNYQLYLDLSIQNDGGFLSPVNNSTSYYIGYINNTNIIINNTTPGIDYKDYYTFCILTELDNSSGVVLTDTNGGIIGEGFKEFEIGKFDFESSDFWCGPGLLGDNVFYLTPNGGNESSCYSIKIGNTSSSNTIIAKQLISNIIGDFFYSNIIDHTFQFNAIANDFFKNSIGNNTYYNVIGNSFCQNILSGSFYYNTIDNDFYSNIIDTIFYNNRIYNSFGVNIIYKILSNNTIGSGFNTNTIGNSFTSNTIGNEFYLNIIKDSFNSNLIYSGFQYNSIGNNFYSNTQIGDGISSNIIGDGFTNNIIRGGFYGNNIGNSCQGNDLHWSTHLIILDGFINNIFEIDMTNVDFTTATLVYNNIQQCIRKLFKNSAGTPRLSYYNENDQLVITDITA